MILFILVDSAIYKSIAPKPKIKKATQFPEWLEVLRFSISS
jgi:hypothetical protein